MNYTCNILIERADTGNIAIVTKADKLKAINGLPSGKPIALVYNKMRIVIKPYYRRFINGELHIFAVEIPTEATKNVT